MKLIGVLFVVLSAGSVGVQITLAMGRRCQLIRQLMSIVQLLKNEIAFCGTPLPQAFALAAASASGGLAQVFSTAAKEMDKFRWLRPQSALERALEAHSFLREGDPIRSVLLELGAKLGKYDMENQLQGLELALVQLEEERQAAEQERRLRGRTYETLGVCAGLAIAILFL